ncbi:MAG: PAS domain S-box protein [Kiritimatiellae bacterium]|nr:PAS domain S-box protein [Kiritimatiellia bacterium]
MPDTPNTAQLPPPGDETLARTIAIAKRELEQMMDLNPQGMLLIDAGGQISRVNRAIVDLTGAGGFDALLGQPFAAIFADGDEEFVSRIIDSEGTAESFDRHVTLPNGFVRELRFSVAGAASGVRVMMVADITGEKERRANQESEHKKEAVAALIGGLMHNINQPLTVVTVTAKLMEMGLDKPTPDVEELRKNLSTISDLVMQIKQMLEKVEAASDYVTEEYLAGKRILDISKL